MKIPSHLKNSALVFSAIFAAQVTFGSTDYGPAIWRPPCNANYNTSGNGHKFHVVHDIEGYYWSTISMFNACGYSAASVHYLVNGKKDNSSDALPGEITQSVRDAHYAWHARCWNSHSTGTEHEGFASNPAWFTPEMYSASAGVTRNLATRFGWAKDRNHIIAHGQKTVAGWPAYASANLGIDPNCNDHTDPGPHWNWSHYMSLINPPAERVDTFVRGPGDNLYIRSYNNGTWFDWANLGGGLTSDPSSVSWGANRIDVFVRGPGNNLYHKAYDNGTWFGWANLGETLVGAPDAASWGPGNINVFWRGTDNALWFKQFSGGVWNPAARLGGTLTSDPAAVSWGPNRVDVFFRGPTGTCDTVTWNGTSWVWWSLGGGITDGPDVCSWGPGRLDVFARGSDNALWIRSYENGWFNWASLGGNFTSGPGATSRAPGILDAFIRNPDGTMAQADWNGSAWTWSNKGGGLTGGPDACSWTNP